MKHFTFILSLVAIVISIIAGGLVLRHESQWEKGRILLSNAQQEQVKDLITAHYDSIQNPAFASVQQVFEFFNRSETSDNLIADFKAIPIDVIVNVAQVCLDKQPYIRLSDIVNSYKEHKDVYDKLVSSGIIEDVESLADRPCNQDSLATEAISTIINDSTPKANESNSNPPQR